MIIGPVLNSAAPMLTAAASLSLCQRALPSPHLAPDLVGHDAAR
jgi:hypothetical protein